ncbi:hypothetical protein GMLC_38970 [Geomonas limicola]|uniref:Uncharacterized protein n=1 Tax=Geomonas limicola TaxID=2740186 RepID=A0A6V8NCH0_9BACT|nr:hypothetical protein [Geomonas limicola]GFO70318.1 hypothetical protein GMLC_38970 [Geomonas limicola]
MLRVVVVMLLAQLLLAWGTVLAAEDVGECRTRCETENTDCVNQQPNPDPDLQAAQLAQCERRLQICYGECENLKPMEPHTLENTPNVIVK